MGSFAWHISQDGVLEQLLVELGVEDWTAVREAMEKAGYVRRVTHSGSSAVKKRVSDPLCLLSSTGRREPTGS